MTGKTREFEPATLRAGGEAVRFTFRVTCSKCGDHADWETPKKMPDDVVRKRFSERKWLLGRNRAYDVCPSCLGVKPENRLADVFRVRTNEGDVEPAAAILADAEADRARRHREAGEAIDRLLAPKPEAQPIPQPSGAADRAPPPSPEALAAAESLAAIAETLSDIRAGNELMVELLQQIIARSDAQIAKQAQTIEAVARIAPVIARSSESLSESLSARLAGLGESLRRDDELQPKAPGVNGHAQRPIRRLPSGTRRGDA